VLFNSAIFPFFLALALLLYYGTARSLRLQNLSVVLLSCVFYGFWDVRFLSLLALSTVVAYGVGLAISATPDEGRRRAFLTLGLGVDLAVLGFFKYFNFFVQNLSDLLRLLGAGGWELEQLHIILPVGISFYTFHTMSYLIDVYRRDFQATRDPIAFACYVAFFPLLVAGPIERAATFLTQILAPRRTTLRQVTSGTYLILWGMYLKVFVGDNLGPLANKVFAAPATQSAAQICVGAVAFSFQIYADFAGYSQIARGVARLLGFELSRNFHLPYLALSPVDFWRRWHITLSTWLRDYVFIPLGGSRSHLYRNLLITMLLGGLWHGAGWHFLLWGLYHGLLLCLFRAIPWLGVEPWGTNHPSRAVRGPARLFWTLLNLALMIMGFAIFRVQETADLATVLPALLSFPFVSDWSGQEWDLLRLAFYITPLALADLAVHLRPGTSWMSTAWPLRAAWYLLLFYSVVLFGGGYGEAFFYFRF
jgi:D-alanyl-lipoteichoic acid acyltransferase DltB (MBOAT superfamily)